MLIKDKIAVITGSGQGLGRAFASKLLKEGAKVCLSDMNEETGLKTLQDLSMEFGKNKVHFIRCDVTKEEDLKALYNGCESYFSSKVDIFCNNAGINHIPGWRKCMEIDIMAVISGSELAMDRMDLRNGGRGGLIINTASLAGIASAMSRESASYFIAKHGVVSLTRALGQPRVLKQTGVKVQCICPAFADTAILSDLETRTKQLIDNKFGVMTPEFVADAFIKLIKHGENGAAICVVKDSPPFIYSDYSKHWIIILTIMGRVMQKVFGTEVLTEKHQIGFVVSIFLIFQFILYLILI